MSEDDTTTDDPPPAPQPATEVDPPKGPNHGMRVNAGDQIEPHIPWRNGTVGSHKGIR